MQQTVCLQPYKTTQAAAYPALQHPLLIQVSCIVQGPLNIPGVSRDSADRHRLAASHSPHMGDGLLAESLETSIPMFGESHLSVGCGPLFLPKDLFFRNSDFHNMLDALPSDACCTMMLDLSHVARQIEMRDVAGQQSSPNTFSRSLDYITSKRVMLILVFAKCLGSTSNAMLLINWSSSTVHMNISIGEYIPAFWLEYLVQLFSVISFSTQHTTWAAISFSVTINQLQQLNIKAAFQWLIACRTIGPIASSCLYCSSAASTNEHYKFSDC